MTVPSDIPQEYIDTLKAQAEATKDPDETVTVNGRTISIKSTETMTDAEVAAEGGDEE